MLSVHPTSDGDGKDHTPVALNHTELLLPWMIGRTNKFCSSSLLGCWKVRMKEGLWAGPALVKTHTEPPSLRVFLALCRLKQKVLYHTGAYTKVTFASRALMWPQICQGKGWRKGSTLR